MAEAMTVETILEADLLLRGFWTRIRYPLKTAKGSWSDIDLLGYDPEKRELVLAESKVRGSKKDVFAFTRATRKKHDNILRFDLRDDGKPNYFSFLVNIKSACKDGAIFKNFTKMVDSLTIQLVSNYYVAPDCMDGARATISKRVRASVPKGIKVRIELETTLDVMARIISKENEYPQGRRYGNAMLDIARELNRYMHPSIKNAGRGRASASLIKKALAGTFESAFR